MTRHIENSPKGNAPALSGSGSGSRSRFEALDPADYSLPTDFSEHFVTPALVVFVDKVRENLQWIVAAMGGEPARWRPHVKTSKIPAIFAEVAAAGVRHFKAATTREVHELLRALRAAGIEGGDILLAYPIRAMALNRLGELAAEYPEARLSVLVEDRDVLAQVPAGLDVFVDINPGMNRTGIPLNERATIAALARASGARLAGLHFYDGHLHSGSDAERRVQAFAGYEALLELTNFLDLERPEIELITSGTPTFLAALDFEPFHSANGPLHRVSPGTVVYHDLRSEQENERLELAPAAQVVAQVVSHPTPGLFTCDAGSKSIAAEAGDPLAFVLGHGEWSPQPASEEHLPVRVERGPLPSRGELVQLIPRHICPTVNLAEEAVLIEGGEIGDVVSVSARSHPLRARR